MNVTNSLNSTVRKLNTSLHKHIIMLTGYKKILILNIWPLRVHAVGILQQKMFSLHNTRHNTLTTYTLNLKLSRISRSPAKLGEFSVRS